MQKITYSLLILVGFLFLFLVPLSARSPLGIGSTETIMPSSGFMSDFFLWLQSWQSKFGHHLSQWLIEFQHNPLSGLWLIGGSFLYGILHAAGPGHGKAIVSSYLVANHETLKKGIILSFFSSILQAISAISIVLIVFFLLPAHLTKTTNFLIKASFFLITGLGLWLFIRKSAALLHQNKAKIKKSSHHHHHQDLTEHQAVCHTCMNSHIVSPQILKQNNHPYSILLLLASTGLRPCTGSIFIMSFAVLNNLILLGSLAVFATAFGTFITVALLAGLTVYTQNFILKLTADPTRKLKRQLLLEWCGALFILLTGLTLLISSFF